MPYIQRPAEPNPSLPPNSLNCYVVIFRPTGGLTFNSYTCYFSLRAAKALISRFVGCDPSLKTKPLYSITGRNPETRHHSLFNKETYAAALAAGVYREPPGCNGGGRGFSHFSEPISGRGFSWTIENYERHYYVPAREDFIIVPARLSIELNPSAFIEPQTDDHRFPPLRI